MHYKDIRTFFFTRDFVKTFKTSTNLKKKILTPPTDMSFSPGILIELNS
jgi:hypothetical protein